MSMTLKVSLLFCLTYFICKFRNTFNGWTAKLYKISKKIFQMALLTSFANFQYCGFYCHVFTKTEVSLINYKKEIMINLDHNNHDGC